MLKGNLVVGKNQSVVLHAGSLKELLELAASKGPQPVGTSAQRMGDHTDVRLRIDLAQNGLPLEILLNSEKNATVSSHNDR